MALGWQVGTFYKAIYQDNGEQILTSAKAVEFEYKELSPFRGTYDPNGRFNRAVLRGQIGALNTDIKQGDKLGLQDKKFVVVQAITRPNPAKPGQQLNILDIEG